MLNTIFLAGLVCVGLSELFNLYTEFTGVQKTFFQNGGPNSNGLRLNLVENNTRKSTITDDNDCFVILQSHVKFCSVRQSPYWQKGVLLIFTI